MKFLPKETKETKTVFFSSSRLRRAGRNEAWRGIVSLSASEGRGQGEGSVLSTLRIRNLQNEFLRRELRLL